MFTEIFPKISCVMVTTGRVEHVKRSVKCYLQQTYRPRELIIVSQGNDEDNAAIQSYVAPWSDVMFFPASSRLSLGALRNLSCEIATGELICQWDDDDLYHPVRVLAQYRAIRSAIRCVGSAYTAFLKYFADTRELYWCNWVGESKSFCRYLPGSVMFYKRCFYEAGSKLYPESGPQCHVEEDLNVLRRLLFWGQVVPVCDALHYVYVYHGVNTYERSHHQLTLLTDSGKLVMSADELLQHRSSLEEVLRVVGVDPPVRVRSPEAEAFTYEGLV